MNINQLCMKCMIGKLNEEGMCTSCGAIDSSEKNGSMHLPVRTILRGKYLIGRVIGEGGFGITYIGFDLDLEIRVAIKEFCPKQYVGREAEDGLTVYPYNEKDAEFFNAEKEKFINEARRLAKFRNEGGVISVLDYFIENGTSYIVMDYIDGITLKNYLKTLHSTTGNNMSMAGVLNLFKPVMETLDKIHKANIIHRDISPENIMISKDFTKVYLIDFGTARDIKDGYTLSEYSKSFYTPIEQMSEKMKQGPWTDVYALCATIYVCITGRTIPESVSRLVEDDLIGPREHDADISETMEAVLLKGLAVKPEERIRSIEELVQALHEEEGKDCTETYSVQDKGEEQEQGEKQEQEVTFDNLEIDVYKKMNNSEKQTLKSGKNQSYRILASILFMVSVFIGIIDTVNNGGYIFTIFTVVSDIIILIALCRNKKDFVLIVGLITKTLLRFRDAGAVLSNGDIFEHNLVVVLCLLGAIGNMVLGIVFANKGMLKGKELVKKIWSVPLICYVSANMISLLSRSIVIEFNIVYVIGVISFWGGNLFLAKWIVNKQEK